MAVAAPSGPPLVAKSRPTLVASSRNSSPVRRPMLPKIPEMAEARLPLCPPPDNYPHGKVPPHLVDKNAQNALPGSPARVGPKAPSSASSSRASSVDPGKIIDEKALAEAVRTAMGSLTNLFHNFPAGSAPASSSGNSPRGSVAAAATYDFYGDTPAESVAGSDRLDMNEVDGALEEMWWSRSIDSAWSSWGSQGWTVGPTRSDWSQGQGWESWSHPPTPPVTIVEQVDLLGLVTEEMVTNDSVPADPFEVNGPSGSTVGEASEDRIHEEPLNDAGESVEPVVPAGSESPSGTASSLITDRITFQITNVFIGATDVCNSSTVDLTPEAMGDDEAAVRSDATLDPPSSNSSCGSNGMPVEHILTDQSYSTYDQPS